MRLAAKAAHDQSAVWQSVAESQEALGTALNKSVHAAHSPTSYQLSVEDPDLENRKRDYEQKLGRLPKSAPDVPVQKGMFTSSSFVFFSRRQDRELLGAVSRGLLACPCPV